MKCNYLKLLNRYIDNELLKEKKEFMDNHILSCLACIQELKHLGSLRQNILKSKINSNPEFFWQTLKSRIVNEERIQYPAGNFAFDFAEWAKRLIPVPILASILVVILLSLSQKNSNLVDEYLFANQDSSVLELIENSGSQSDTNTLLFNKAKTLRSQPLC